MTTRSARPPRWWREVLYIGLFYGAYTLIRNQFGSASVSAAQAADNARRIISIEQSLRMFNEAALQSHFLGWGWFLRFWNIFYGSLHFVIPVAVLVFLYRGDIHEYRLRRTTLLATTGIALLGYSLFPLMPPRLLCDCPHGAGPGIDYGFVDTLAVHGGLWSFGSHTVSEVSNQYAAMPSLHFAWALWCTLTMWPHMRRWWTRCLLALFPVATLFAIVVTANHYWLDAAAGAVTLWLGTLTGGALVRLYASRRPDTYEGEAVP